MAKAKAEKKRTCFVIAPIGEEGSDTRKRSDQILKHVIEPVVTDRGYGKPVRADRISRPGMITTQVIRRIIEDDLVIADLTGRNPNVFYELAIRHAVRKPVVQLMSADDELPFDVKDARTILLDHTDLDSVENAKAELVRQIQTVEANPAEADSPVSVALDLQSMRASEKPEDQRAAEIIETLRTVRAEINALAISGGRSRRNMDPLARVVVQLDRLDRVLIKVGDLVPNVPDVLEAQRAVAEIRELLVLLCVEWDLDAVVLVPGLLARRGT